MVPKPALILCLILWLSCKKNKDATVPLPLLAKIESTLNGETVTITTQFSAGKIVLMEVAGTSAGKPVYVLTKLIRNPEGIIQKIVIKNPVYLTTFSTDSIVYTVIYSGAEKRYTSMVNHLFYKTGATEVDSTFFSYDDAGKVKQAIKLANEMGGQGFKEVERNEFTYNRDNLIRCKNYQLNSLFLEQTVEYDNSVNPLAFNKEWILIGSTRNNRRFEQSSFNNATTLTYNYNQNGSTSTTTMTYTYNASNLPASRIDNLPNGSIQTVTYHYQ